MKSDKYPITFNHRLKFLSPCCAEWLIAHAGFYPPNILFIEVVMGESLGIGALVALDGGRGPGPFHGFVR